MIVSDIRHLVCDDQVMLHIHGGLNVVVHYAEPLPLVAMNRGSGSIIDRCLPGCFFNFFDLFELTHLLAQAGDLLGQAQGLHIEACWTGPVCGFNQVEISLSAFLNPLLTPVDPACRVVPVAAVQSLELATVDRQHVNG